MDKKSHYKQQLTYYEKEFSGNSEYKLSAWQESYIEKIKNFLLNKDFQRKKLLDIGTGSGYVAIEMAKLGMNVIACDLSPQAIKNLKRYREALSLQNLRLIVCNAEKIPLEDGTVDYILANAILEHIPNEKQAIGEWKRILKPGGRMFITVPLKFRFIWPFFWLVNFIHDKRLGHLRRYDLESLTNKFKLNTVKIFYTGHFVKVVGVLISILLRTHKLDKQLEIIDQKNENKQYGANNIAIIFEK